MQMEIEALDKAFGDKQVLTGLQFTFEQGKIYGLLGRNGAGKTTLFNCLSGEMQPDHGSVRLRQGGQCAPLEDEQVGYVYATPILPEFLTGHEFLRFFTDINRERLTPGRTIDDYFDLVKIDPEDRHRLIKGYSHGMKNKLQMLCFLISRPPVILLDEPLTSFDVVVALEMKQLLRDMKGQHIILFSTHILQLATDLCDEIVVLNHGRLEAVDAQWLHQPDFEQHIIDMLEDQGHA